MAEPRSSGANVPTQSVLMVQIRDLGERMEANFQRLSVRFDELEKRMRESEANQPAFRQRLEAVERQLADNCKQTEALERAVLTLNNAIAIARWLGGLVGGALILWLIGRLTGLL